MYGYFCYFEQLCALVELLQLLNWILFSSSFAHDFVCMVSYVHLYAWTGTCSINNINNCASSFALEKDTNGEWNGLKIVASSLAKCVYFKILTSNYCIVFESLHVSLTKWMNKTRECLRDNMCWIWKQW